MIFRVFSYKNPTNTKVLQVMDNRVYRPFPSIKIDFDSEWYHLPNITT